MSKGDNYRPTDLGKYGKNYDNIFGNRKVSRSTGRRYHNGPTGKGVVDIHGNPIKLSSRQKNAIYAKAKKLKSEIKDSLCTFKECQNPSERNVQKMIHGELKNKNIEAFKKNMKAIGADPKDYNTEKLRRG